MRRFFLPLDVHHIRDVLRLKIGDEIELLDGRGKVMLARISELGKENISYDILSSRSAESEPKVNITLAQALPKASKMDFIIEKCVELGVHRLIPITTARTVAKKARVDRWQKIAKSAAEQSGRAIIPEISPLASFEDIIKMRAIFDLALIPWEAENSLSLKKSLYSLLLPQFPRILVVVGSEGGFSQAEIAAAKLEGFTTVSLGKRILRSETAGLVTIANIIYELE